MVNMQFGAKLKRFGAQFEILRNFHPPAMKQGGRDDYETRRYHAGLWDERVGVMLSHMMKLAGYSTESLHLHASFFTERVAGSLGPYPVVGESWGIWKSFMTDDNTPLELSWSWSGKHSTPIVRYSTEPIGWFAGSASDPMNTQACIVCLGDTLPLACDLDLQWFRHFSKALTVPPEDLCARKAVINSSWPSQAFIAFDLGERSMVVKYYFFPSFRASSLGISNLKLVEESILALPTTGNTLKAPLDIVTGYIRSFPLAQQPQVEIVAIDCVEPLQSRVKIYVRSHKTSFNDMIDFMTLGGKGQNLSQSTLSSLKELWSGCFAVETTPDELTRPLRDNCHRTAGLLYYYELRLGAVTPTSKVYLPVRHYAKDDAEVARGVSRFLQKSGKTLEGSLSYYDGLQKLCKHRSLEDGLGFQTYITLSVKGDDISISTYINPEVYGARRT